MFITFQFDLANFELYSNSPKDIVISGSHRFPSRDWTLIGKFEGQEGNRGIQSFPININEDFFKYFKVIDISSTVVIYMEPSEPK